MLHDIRLVSKITAILTSYENYDVNIFMISKKQTSKRQKTPAEHLGGELRSLRKAHGLSLKQLAEKSGKSLSFLSKIERGLARPSITALQDIAEVLGVPIGWF
ncbi:MAG: helix-turn-helix transcriptional regulator, partial [Nitratireductor sp.]